MKKILSVLIIFIITLSLSACSLLEMLNPILNQTTQNNNEPTTTVTKANENPTKLVEKDNQGVYVDGQGEMAYVYSDRVIIGEEEYSLLSDSEGVYALVDGQKQYLVFGEGINIGGIEIKFFTFGDHAFNITNHRLPIDINNTLLETSEVYQKIQEIYDSIKSFESQESFAYEASFSISISNEKTGEIGEIEEEGFDLLALLDGLSIEGSGSINIQNFNLRDLSNMLGLIVFDIDGEAGEEKVSEHVRVNFQDGKIYIVSYEDDPEYKKYEVDEIPDDIDFEEVSDFDLIDVLKNVYSEDSFSDFAEVFNTFLAIEDGFKDLDFTIDDIEELYSDLVTFEEGVLDININSEKLTDFANKLKRKLREEIIPKLENVYQIMLENFPDMEIESSEQFEEFVLTYINKYTALIDELLNEITINDFSIHLDLNTYELSVNINFSICDVTSLEDEETGEEVVSTSETTFQISISFEQKDVVDVERVDPQDYIVTYQKIIDGVKEHLPELDFPAFPNEYFECDMERYEHYNGGVSYNFDLDDLDLEDARLLFAHLVSQIDEELDTEESTYCSKSYVDSETILNISISMGHSYSEEDDDNYYLSITIEKKENDLDRVSVIVEEGIEIEFDRSFDDYVCLSDWGEISGRASWKDSSKTLVTLWNDQILSYNNLICDYDYSEEGELIETIIGPAEFNTNIGVGDVEIEFKLMDFNPWEDDYLYVRVDEYDADVLCPTYALRDSEIKIKVSPSKYVQDVSEFMVSYSFNYNDEDPQTTVVEAGEILEINIPEDAETIIVRIEPNS